MQVPSSEIVGHRAAMWRDTWLPHVIAHGDQHNVKCCREGVLNSTSATFTSTYLVCSALRSHAMAIKQATSIYSPPLWPSLLLSVIFSVNSPLPLVHGPHFSRLSLPSCGNSSPMLSTTPSWSCAFSPQTIMLRRHRMRCRRVGRRGLPSRPPLSHSLGYDLNLSVGWEEQNRNAPVNLTTQLSLQLLVPPLAPFNSRSKKRPRKSTIPPEPAFIPGKMKALLVQSASSDSKDTSGNTGNSDGSSSDYEAENKTEHSGLQAASFEKLDSPASPRPQNSRHALSKENDDAFYVCRIEEEDPTFGKKNEGFP